MAAPPDLSRTLILGNSGSGKSWLAERLAGSAGTRPLDLDDVHWEPGGYGRRRDPALATALVREAAEAPHWVIEGVYGWLAGAAIARATALIWLDLPVDACLAAIRRRGPRRGGDAAALSALLAWAADYPVRRTSSSFGGHAEIYAAFPRGKCRVTSRAEMDMVVAAASRPR